MDSTPDSSVKGAFPLADLNPGFPAAPAVVRIESNAYIGLSFLDQAHQLLCGESLVRVCGGQGCDARHLVRVNNDVFSLAVSMCLACARAAASFMAACRSWARGDDNSCGMSAKIAFFFNLPVEEATSINDGACLLRGCITLTSR